MFHKVLVAMDCSQISHYVFDEALSLAKAFKANMMLLHVLTVEEEGILYTPTMLSSPAGSSVVVVNERIQELYQQQCQTLKTQSVEKLRTLTDKAIAAGVSTEFTQTYGDPGRTICDYAGTWGADLIIVGRRGLSGLSELILGSVSNYVLHHAPCSVLTLQHTPVV